MKTSITKKLLLLFVVLGATCGAFADTTFWQNSSNGTATILCDTYLASCGGPGWIVYDDFVVSGQTRITDFTYTDFFSTGQISSYVSTKWFVFGPSAADPFGPPAYSGTAVATSVLNGDGSYTFSITGLNLPVTDGTWIVGFSNILNDPNAVTTRADSDDPRLPEWWQQNTTGTDQRTLPGNTAFSVSTSAVPEPSSLMLFSSAILGLAGVLRQRLMG
jgi:hypothetical protein